MAQILYLIPTLYARDALYIARSYGLKHTQWRWVRFEDRCSSNYDLPKGYKADLSICVIKSEKGQHGSLDKVHRAWHEFLFDILPEETKQNFYDQVANTLDGFLWCDRVWEAWSVGTMSQDDFSPAGDDEDVIYEHAVNMHIMFLEMKL